MIYKSYSVKFLGIGNFRKKQKYISECFCYISTKKLISEMFVNGEDFLVYSNFYCGHIYPVLGWQRKRKVIIALIWRHSKSHCAQLMRRVGVTEQSSTRYPMIDYAPSQQVKCCIAIMWHVSCGCIVEVLSQAESIDRFKSFYLQCVESDKNVSKSCLLIIAIILSIILL